MRGMRSESSRHGLSILMVTESSGNISPYNSFSDSTIKKKHYTPLIHNTLCDGVYCTDDPRYAIYHYYVGKLILPHHYYIHMFRLLKTYTMYAPKYLTILGNVGILTHGKPSNRERESAYYCITDG